MKIIGLCGGSGAGKGYVCGIFSRYGIPAIDTDAVYHNIIAKRTPCVTELEETFGPSVVREDGSLNREALAAIVFADGAADKLQALNRITHQYIKTETEQEIEAHRQNGAPAVIVDAPALFESGFDRMCDFTVGVLADREIRLGRIMNRDGISRDRAEARISRQIPDGELKNKCRYCIVNNGEDVESQVRQILSAIGE